MQSVSHARGEPGSRLVGDTVCTMQACSNDVTRFYRSRAIIINYALSIDHARIIASHPVFIHIMHALRIYVVLDSALCPFYNSECRYVWVRQPTSNPVTSRIS